MPHPLVTVIMPSYNAERLLLNQSSRFSRRLPRTGSHYLGRCIKATAPSIPIPGFYSVTPHIWLELECRQERLEAQSIM